MGPLIFSKLIICSPRKTRQAEIIFNYEFLEVLGCYLYICWDFFVGFFGLICEKKLVNWVCWMREEDPFWDIQKGVGNVWACGQEKYVTIVYTPPVKFICVILMISISISLSRMLMSIDIPRFCPFPCLMVMSQETLNAFCRFFLLFTLGNEFVKAKFS